MDVLQQVIDYLGQNWKEVLLGGGVLAFILKISYDKWLNKLNLLLKVVRCDFEAARNGVTLLLNLEISNHGKLANSVKDFSCACIRPRSLIMEEANTQAWPDGLIAVEHRLTPVAGNPSELLNTAIPFVLNPGETVRKWLYLWSPNLAENQSFKMKLIIEDTFGKRRKVSFSETCQYPK